MTSRDSNNENIVVHDTSIIQSNEHPKFKIGDVINNGYGDFTVKGFTRSFMGLAYVLDNGNKLINILTEQVDAKFHLVEQKQSMHKIPDKIYLHPTAKGEVGASWLTFPLTNEDVAYVRAEAFIEAVANWMSDNLQTVSEVETPSAHHVESIPALGIITQTEFIEKFKKEIMFLLD